MLTELEILLQQQTLKIHRKFQQLLAELADHRLPIPGLLAEASVENGLRCCSAERNSPFSPDRTRRMDPPTTSLSAACASPDEQLFPLPCQTTGAVPDHRKRKGAEPLDSFPKALRSSHDSTSSRMVVPLLDNLIACACFET